MSVGSRLPTEDEARGTSHQGRHGQSHVTAPSSSRTASSLERRGAIHGGTSPRLRDEHEPGTRRTAQQGRSSSRPGTGGRSSSRPGTSGPSSSRPSTAHREARDPYRVGRGESHPQEHRVPPASLSVWSVDDPSFNAGDDGRRRRAAEDSRTRGTPPQESRAPATGQTGSSPEGRPSPPRRQGAIHRPRRGTGDSDTQTTPPRTQAGQSQVPARPVYVTDAQGNPATHFGALAPVRRGTEDSESQGSLQQGQAGSSSRVGTPEPRRGGTPGPAESVERLGRISERTPRPSAYPPLTSPGLRAEGIFTPLPPPAAPAQSAPSAPPVPPVPSAPPGPPADPRYTIIQDEPQEGSIRGPSRDPSRSRAADSRETIAVYLEPSGQSTEPRMPERPDRFGPGSTEGKGKQRER